MLSVVWSDPKQLDAGVRDPAFCSKMVYNDNWPRRGRNRPRYGNPDVDIRIVRGVRLLDNQTRVLTADTSDDVERDTSVSE